MFVAQKLKKENIAEYLLYMWQVEDLLRACHLDIDTVQERYLSRFTDLSPEQAKEQRQWYADLIQMMRSEGKAMHGHLQVNQNTLQTLSELHQQLLSNPDRYPYYRTAYYNALPSIVELRRKSGSLATGELETCFNLLYGIMLLRLQGKTIEPGTQKALHTISELISMLAGYYRQNEESPLEFE